MRCARAPGRYARHLSPLLARLLPAAPARCDVDDLARAVAGFQATQLGLHARVREQVDRLRFPSSTARSEAERSLVQMGLPALSLIQAAQAGDLDAEQRSRLRRVEREISPETADTPAQLARWLATDIGYWKLVAHNVPLHQREELDLALLHVVGQQLGPVVQVADAAR